MRGVNNMSGLFRSGIRTQGMAAVGIFVLMASCLPALAALGGDVNSVQADAAQMKGTVKIQSMQAYTVHEISGPARLVVREYVSADGRVFGVAWHGMFTPNMQQILGTYVQQFSAAVADAHSKYVGRRPLSIHQPGLVVELSGHIHDYYGRVFVPTLVPQGVDSREVK